MKVKSSERAIESVIDFNLSQLAFRGLGLTDVFSND
jgi:hypothetical protein